jgi:ubiquitin C
MKLPIFIRLISGKILFLNVEPNESIDNIKAMIHQQESDIPPNQQRLVYSGTELENGGSLQDYGIQKESTIHLVIHKNPKFEVFVRSVSGKPITIQVSSTMLVDDFFKEVGVREGVEPRLIRMSYAGKNLELGTTLEHYNIQNQSTLQLVAKFPGG